MGNTYKTGKKLSQIQKITDYKNLLSSDLFLCSNPSNSYYNGYHKDVVSTTKELVDTMEEQLIAKLNLKSMAYEDKDDYSLIGHKHDYSKVEITSFNSYNPKKDQYLEESGQLSILAQIDIDGKKTNINALAAVNPKEPIRYIGELMFVAYPTLNDIDESSEDFDGFCYPDGRKLQKNQFSDAYEYFGDEYKQEGDEDDTFRIPTLSDFICLNPMEVQTECCQRMDFQNGVMSHTHQLEFLMNATTLTKQVKIGVGGVNQASGGIHRGDLTTPQMPDKITGAIVRLSSDNLYLDHEIKAETNNMEITETESYPTHIMLPVLIYIGKKNNE